MSSSDGSAPATPAGAEIVCPHCGHSVKVTPRQAPGDVELAGCPKCSLQLIRRAAGPWQGIRG